MLLDTSALKPYTPSMAPPVSGDTGGLDVSGLRAYGSPAPTNAPAATSAPANDDNPTPSLSDVAKQGGYGLLSGLPHALEGMADMAAKPLLTNPFTNNNWESDLAKAMGLGNLGGILPPDGEVGPGWAIKQGLGAIGLDPDKSLPAPTSMPERIARGVGEGAVTMLVPEAVGSKLADIPNLLRQLAVGSVSGGASQAATEVAPDQLKPLAGMAGAIAGGAGVEGGFRAAGKAAQGVADLAAPITKGGQQRMAGDVLAKAATDPNAAVTAIDTVPRETVPGSQPTTGQLTGDMGLLGLERATAAQNPEMFNDFRASQNAARVDALSNIQDSGHPEAVSDFFRSQMDDLDRGIQAAQDAAEINARKAAQDVGGEQPPEVVGNQLRDALQTQLDASKAQERALWKAVDPDNSLNVVTGPLKRTVQSIYGDMGPAATLGQTATEKGLAGVIADYGSTIPFNELTDIRSQISQAMREAKSPLQPNDVAYGRLTQLRGAVEDAISDSVQGKVAEEQAAVAAGTLSPQQTTLERWAREAQDIIDAKRTVGRTGSNNAAVGDGGSPAVPASNRGAGEAVVQPGGTAGNPQGAGPLVDQAAADRLATATNATKERKQTFGAKPVSAILQRPGNSLPYTMAPENIAAQVWRKGPEGAATVRSVLAAAKGAPEAIDAIRTGAAASLRKAALNPDGTINPAKFETWKAAHAEPLAALEQAAPKSTAPYENAAKAGANLELIAKQRKTQIDAMQKSEAGKLLGLTDPSDITKTIGGLFGRKDSVKAFRELASRASGNPDAMEGLRKSIIDFMSEKLISNTEAGTSDKNLIKSDQFQTFLGKNAPALRQVFSDAELDSMRAIAQDLKRANRSITAVKLPGGSNTAQDTAAIGKHVLAAPTILNRLLEIATGASAGALVGGGLEGGLTGLVLGAAGGQIGHWLANLRSAGISNINDLVRDAMLNPDLAKTLLLKASKRAGAGSDVTFAQQLQRMALQGAALHQAQ